MRLGSSVALLALGVFGTPLRSRAADCSDGWFCAEAPPAPAPAPPPRPPANPPQRPASPTVPLPPPWQTPRQTAVAAPPPPLPAEEAPKSEIAFNLHLDVGLLGSGAKSDAGLGGVGFGFRIRPVPLYALDLGLEFLGGTDYNGNDRAEQAFAANAVVFVNPRDKVQAFVLAGVHIGGAQVRIAELGGQPLPLHDVAYTYLGAQGGLGVEWRFTRSAAITGDFQLFVRGRVDSNSYYEPEYVDADTHFTTNTSGGGLFRLGVTFYF
jgi:hypothetical protein